jgi:preprotein translocase subunit SecG
MLYNILLFLHVVVVISLVGIILVQRGRSGGLVEALGGVESIFGTKTSSFFVKLTVVLAVLFFVTSISLAYLAKERGKSIMDRYKNEAGSEQPVSADQTKSTATSANQTPSAATNANPTPDNKK